MSLWPSAWIYAKTMESIADRLLISHHIHVLVHTNDWDSQRKKVTDRYTSVLHALLPLSFLFSHIFMFALRSSLKGKSKAECVHSSNSAFVELGIVAERSGNMVIRWWLILSSGAIQYVGVCLGNHVDVAESDIKDREQSWNQDLSRCTWQVSLCKGLLYMVCLSSMSMHVY